METCSFLSLYDTLLLQILIALYAKAYFFDVVLMYRFIMKLCGVFMCLVSADTLDFNKKLRGAIF